MSQKYLFFTLGIDSKYSKDIYICLTLLHDYLTGRVSWWSWICISVRILRRLGKCMEGRSVIWCIVFSVASSGVTFFLPLCRQATRGHCSFLRTLCVNAGSDHQVLHWDVYRFCLSLLKPASVNISAWRKLRTHTWPKVNPCSPHY